MKKYKPTSAGRRGMTVVSYGAVLTSTRNTPAKSLTQGARSTGGRNSNGNITAHYRGGGHKQTYRDVDFIYNKKDIPAVVETIEYDPFRSGFIAVSYTHLDVYKRQLSSPVAEAQEPSSYSKNDKVVVYTSGNSIP